MTLTKLTENALLVLQSSTNLTQIKKACSNLGEQFIYLFIYLFIS